MSLIKFQGNSIKLDLCDEYVFLLSTKEASKGFGCSEDAIRQSKSHNQHELIEGKHFITIRNSNNAKKIMWTKRGIVRLGFFIKSEKAKAFRDWAEDYVIEGQKDLQIGQEQYDLLKETVIQQNAQIAQLTIELKAKPKRLPPKPKISLSESNLLLDLIGQIAREIDEDERIEEIKRKRREKKKRFFYAFVKSMNHSGITEQSQRKSEEF